MGGIHVAVVSVHREERERRAVSRGRRAPRRARQRSASGASGASGEGAGLDDGRRRGVVDHADAERVAGEDAEDLARVDRAGVGGGRRATISPSGARSTSRSRKRDAVATLDAKSPERRAGARVDARTVAAEGAR